MVISSPGLIRRSANTVRPCQSAFGAPAWFRKHRSLVTSSGYGLPSGSDSQMTCGLRSAHRPPERTTPSKLPIVWPLEILRVAKTPNPWMVLGRTPIMSMSLEDAVMPSGESPFAQGTSEKRRTSPTRAKSDGVDIGGVFLGGDILQATQAATATV